jgi:hypothetical protein
MDAMKEPRMLRVWWRDSAGYSGWRLPDECTGNKPMLCQSAGFFVEETKSALTLALNHSSDPATARPFDDLIIIPRAAIVKRRALR